MYGGYSNFSNDRMGQPVNYAGLQQGIYNQQGGYGGGELDKLNQLEGVFIKQKFESCECVFGFETENEYSVSACDRSGNYFGETLMIAKESSNCCTRNCLPGICRPFELKLTSGASGKELLRLDRECTCTCLCLARPNLVVNNVEANRIVGKIVHPFNCCSCDLPLDVYDSSNQLKFQIRGSCCQLGVLCKMPCEPCQIIDFDILDISGNLVSKCQKKSSGCLKAMFSDSGDNFSLLFPSGSSFEDKLLLLSALFLMDYMYFEK